MVVAVKVFKKTTPNGKVTVYLGKRDFIDHLDHTDPIDGVVVLEDGYLQVGESVFLFLVDFTTLFLRAAESFARWSPSTATVGKKMRLWASNSARK